MKASEVKAGIVHSKYGKQDDRVRLVLSVFAGRVHYLEGWRKDGKIDADKYPPLRGQCNTAYFAKWGAGVFSLEESEKIKVQLFEAEDVFIGSLSRMYSHFLERR